MRIYYREDFAKYLVANNMLGNVAEVGVAYGGFLHHNMSIWRGKRYYAIDPWKDYSDYNEFPYPVDQKMYDKWHDDLRQEYLNDPCVKVVRGTSLEVARNVNAESLDWVFIDGNHTYEYVRDDIKAWYPNVRQGGILSGHDYTIDFPGVIRAVNEFVNTTRQELHLTIDINFQSWWIIK